MSFNFSHIGHASHTEPEVLSVEGSGYRTGYGGLAYPRWTIETEDLPLSGAPQLAHCYELLIGQKRASYVFLVISWDLTLYLCACVWIR